MGLGRIWYCDYKTFTSEIGLILLLSTWMMRSQAFRNHIHLLDFFWGFISFLVCIQFNWNVVYEFIIVFSGPFSFHETNETICWIFFIKFLFYAFSFILFSRPHQGGAASSFQTEVSIDSFFSHTLQTKPGQRKERNQRVRMDEMRMW